VDLVSRGKVGLSLASESEQLVAIDGQQPMMGAPGAAAPAAGAAEVAALQRLHSAALSGTDGASDDGSGGTSSGSIGGGGANGREGNGASDESSDYSRRDGSAEAADGSKPGSVVAVRLMAFRHGWAAGTVSTSWQ